MPSIKTFVTTISNFQIPDAKKNMSHNPRNVLLIVVQCFNIGCQQTKAFDYIDMCYTVCIRENHKSPTPVLQRIHPILYIGSAV